MKRCRVGALYPHAGQDVTVFLSNDGTGAMHMGYTVSDAEEDR
jgi:hypothetical protein